jgi:hypothetical protein
MTRQDALAFVARLHQGEVLTMKAPTPKILSKIMSEQFKTGHDYRITRVDPYLLRYSAA